ADYWKWMGAFIEAHDRLRNIGKPTIARLNGMVVGGGNEFNIACDLAVAADHVTIRQVGMARGSVPAGGANQLLPIILRDRRDRRGPSRLLRKAPRQLRDASPANNRRRPHLLQLWGSHAPRPQVLRPMR